MNKDTILQDLATIFEETFEIDASHIALDAHLYDDLDLDSIDAIDLVVKIQDKTGRKVSPEDFKSARTVDDVVKIISALLDS